MAIVTLIFDLNISYTWLRESVVVASARSRVSVVRRQVDFATDLKINH